MSGLYRIREGIYSKYPRNDLPAIEPMTTKPGKSTHPMVKLDYVPWSKYFLQCQVVARYGIEHLPMLENDPVVREWAYKVLAGYLAKDVCLTKGVDKRASKKPENWRIRHICLLLESGTLGKNDVMITRTVDLGKKGVWGQVATLDWKTPPSIYQYNPRSRPYLFGRLNYVFKDGHTFETGKESRDYCWGFYVSNGPVWADMSLLKKV